MEQAIIDSPLGRIRIVAEDGAITVLRWTKDAGETAPPAPGSLDFVRMPLDRDEREPSMQRLPGASISEWDWFDAGHLELLRRQSLVLVAAEGTRHALVVDAIGDRVDVVVRSVVPQLRSIPGLAGAAILGDGQVVLLLDVGQLVAARTEVPAADLEAVD